MDDDPDKTSDALGPPPQAPVAVPRGEQADYAGLSTVDAQHYVIGDPISEGGMGRVVSARDRRLGRVVAIKELLPRNRDRTWRFEQEARITASLQHPAIIHVYEAGRWPGGEPFYAMTKVVGRSLDKVVAEKPTLAERLGLLRNVITAVDALAYAHDKGVIHRDLKPSNVLVGDYGETVVIDWGLAKQRAADEPHLAPVVEGEDSPRMTAHGSVLGTPAYMPLEQARGEAVDERADVYSLGALAYHVLSGAAPYTGDTGKTVLAQVIAAAPPPMREREPGVPIDLAAIIDKAMARDRLSRYPSAKELAEDLKRFETGRLVAARHYTLPQRLGRWVRRNALVVAIAAVAVVILAVGGTISILRILDARRVADNERAVAEARRTALLVEQGRAQLEVGRAGRALAYLSTAYERGEDGPINRFLIAEALRPFAGELAQLRVGGAVLAVAWSPDGKLVATAGESGRVSIWRADGAFVKDLVTHHNRVHTIAFGRDGNHLILASDEPIAKLWDIAAHTYQVLAHYPDGVQPMGARANMPEYAVTTAEFSRDGTRVLTAGKDGTVRVWATRDGAELHRIVIGEPISFARLSGDSARVVAATERGIAMWSLDRQRLATADGNALAGPAVDARFAPGDAVVLVATGERRLVAIDVSSRAQLASASYRAGLERIEVAPDGRHALVSSADRGVRIVRLPSLELEFELAHHDEQLIGAVFSPDSRTIATHSRDGSVRLWDARRGVQLGWFEGHGTAVHAVAFGPDGKRLLTGGNDVHARLWDATATVAHATAAELASPPIALARAGAGPLAIARDRGVTLWDPATGRSDEISVEACGIALSPDGAHLVVPSDREVAVIDVRSRKRVTTVPIAKSCAVAHGPGDLVALAGEDGLVRIWRAGTQVRELAAHRAPIRSLAFDATGSRLVSGGDDATAVVWWNVDTGAHEAPLVGRGPLRAVAFSPDGQHVIAGGGGHVAIHALASGRAPIQLDGTPGAVSALTFTPDGSRVVTAGEDGAIRIWAAANGRLLATRNVHAGPVRGIVIDPDGARGFSVALDRNIASWDLGLTSRSASDVAARIPWRLENDLVVARHEVRPTIEVGTEFAMHKVPIGSPVWDVVGATQFRANTGTKADGLSNSLVEIKQILPNHSFQKFMWHTSTPHPPPYDRELPDGIKRLGLPVGTRFKIADWTPPYEIGVIALFVPRADAPVGRTADYASGPMIPDAVSPLAVDLDLLRDGVVVDPDFDPMLPPASTFDPRLEGHSHIVWNFSGGLEYMSRALGTGTYVWRGRVTDQTGQGYEIAFGPLIVEP